jgi:hypothetical protein
MVYWWWIFFIINVFKMFRGTREVAFLERISNREWSVFYPGRKWSPSIRIPNKSIIIWLVTASLFLNTDKPSPCEWDFLKFARKT